MRANTKFSVHLPTGGSLRSSITLRYISFQAPGCTKLKDVWSSRMYVALIMSLLCYKDNKETKTLAYQKCFQDLQYLCVMLPWPTILVCDVAMTYSTSVWCCHDPTILVCDVAMTYSTCVWCCHNLQYLCVMLPWPTVLVVWCCDDLQY